MPKYKIWNQIDQHPKSKQVNKNFKARGVSGIHLSLASKNATHSRSARKRHWCYERDLYLPLGNITICSRMALIF